MNNNIKISPSLFAADIFDLRSQIEILEKSKVDLLHIDVMDGNFVSRMAFGAEHIQMIKRHTKIPLDVHLMVKYPERHISDILEAGADIITIHQESTSSLYHCLEMIQRKGRMAGVVLSPATPVQNIKYILSLINMVLIMTVNPGSIINKSPWCISTKSLYDYG